MYWFSSDWHLNHTNIIKYCNRPFSSASEMDKVIIDNINKDVKYSDHLFFLGDFAFVKNDIEKIYRLRDKISCRNIYFILGNHDKVISEFKSKLVDQSVFDWIKDYAELKMDGQLIVLSHYCMKVWNKSHRGSWHLYGHSHGALKDDITSLSIDVGIDTKLFGHKSFTPYSLDEVKQIMTKHKKREIINYDEENR